MADHIRILGIIYIIFHALGLVAGILVFGLLSGVGILSGEAEAAGIFVLIGTVIGIMLLALSLPGIIGGVGLLYRKRWARVLVIVIGVLHLANFPFGTALGAYSLWALLHPETPSLFLPEHAT